MSRLAGCFQSLKAKNKTALIPYIAAGDPNRSLTVPLMHDMVEQGADIIELGVPFSDPSADGPTIQLSMERALENKTSLNTVLSMVASFREKDQQTPIVLMGYLNPLERMGYSQFAKKASIAGVDGVLTVDLPPEEAGEFCPILKAEGLDAIFLVAPTTIAERIAKIAVLASGFMYYVSLKGVTGSNTLNIKEVSAKLEQIRSMTDIPLAVGFGIKDAASAAAVGKVAEGVVVGSVLVKKIEENTADAEKITHEIGVVLSAMRKEMDK
ncbi:MAG: tryptophan synthase subunit alpha [Thiotrichaceae bacterium]|nr:tryptophan synthase subunit alpha [Thiotrichaceae bacterium]